MPRYYARHIIAPIGAFQVQETGTIAVTFAVLIVCICGFAGLALDSINAYSSRSTAQHSLDAATLAAVIAGTEDEARTAFDAHLVAEGLDPTKAKFIREQIGTRFRARGAYADVTPSVLGQFLGESQIAYSVRSVALTPATLTSFSLEIDRAYGHSDKDILFWDEHDDGTTEVVATVSYRLTDKTGEGGRGTGTTAISPGSTVEVANLKHMWIEMKVTTSTGMHFSFNTNDNSTANHVFIDSRQLSPGETSVTSLMPCDQTAAYALEDTNKPLGAMQWNQQDLFFNVSTTCETPDGAMAHLTE
ncbi:MAG: Tad domain-containing protein [Hyphomicrobiaceae bacterium]